MYGGPVSSGGKVSDKLIQLVIDLNKKNEPENGEAKDGARKKIGDDDFDAAGRDLKLISVERESDVFSSSIPRTGAVICMRTQ